MLNDVTGRDMLVMGSPNAICARVLLLASSFAFVKIVSRAGVSNAVMFTVATTLPEVNVITTLPVSKLNADMTLDWNFETSKSLSEPGTVTSNAT